MKKTLIVNMFGAPCAGKSTQAAGLFYKLKMRGVECELITEKAKDFTWENNLTAITNQFYVSAHQVYRQERVEGKVDVIITDSPILLGIFYNQQKNIKIKKSFEQFVLETFLDKNNFNVWVNRKHKYNITGRNQNEAESQIISNNIIKFLDYHNIPVFTIDGTKSGLDELTEKVFQEIKNIC